MLHLQAFTSATVLREWDRVWTYQLSVCLYHGQLSTQHSIAALTQPLDLYLIVKAATYHQIHTVAATFGHAWSHGIYNHSIINICISLACCLVPLFMFLRPKNATSTKTDVSEYRTDGGEDIGLPCQGGGIIVRSGTTTGAV